MHWLLWLKGNEAGEQKKPPDLTDGNVVEEFLEKLCKDIESRVVDLSGCKPTWPGFRDGYSFICYGSITVEIIKWPSSDCEERDFAVKINGIKVYANSDDKRRLFDKIWRNLVFAINDLNTIKTREKVKKEQVALKSTLLSIKHIWNKD